MTVRAWHCRVAASFADEARAITPDFVAPVPVVVGRARRRRRLKTDAADGIPGSPPPTQTPPAARVGWRPTSRHPLAAARPHSTSGNWPASERQDGPDNHRPAIRRTCHAR
jgi:hypothetical protein